MYANAAARYAEAGNRELAGHMSAQTGQAHANMARNLTDTAAEHYREAYLAFWSAAKHYDTASSQLAWSAYANAAAMALNLKQESEFDAAIGTLAPPTTAHEALRIHNLRASAIDSLNQDFLGASKSSAESLETLARDGLLDIESTDDMDVFDIGQLATLLARRAAAPGRPEVLRLRDGKAALRLYLRQFATYRSTDNSAQADIAIDQVKWLYWIMAKYTTSAAALKLAKDELVDELKGQFEDAIIDALPDTLQDAAQAAVDSANFVSDAIGSFSL